MTLSGHDGGLRLQPLVRARLAALGAGGQAWVAGLPSRLAELEELWGVVAERRSLPGGSASLVVAATTDDGELCAIKLAVPGTEVSAQARVLAAAQGRGYARLLAHDPACGALLLERLGRSAEQTPGEPEEVLGPLAATLRLAWTAPASVAPLPAPGEDKASTLHRLVGLLASQTDHDASPTVITQALAYARRRAAAHDPTRCVVAHGDPHPANLLRVLAERPGGETGWAFVDPDGFRADPAYDVAVTLRDWSSRLLGPDAPARLEGWCRLMAEATGQDEQAVWEWAFLERVSTGLYVTSIGSPGVGRPFLASAQAPLAGAR